MIRDQQSLLAKTSMTCVTLVMCFTACGAPTKKGSDVGRQFDANGSKPLSEKASETLGAFKTYLSDAKVAMPPFDFGRYTDAGSRAYSLNSPNSLAFVPIDYIPGGKTGEIVNGAYRGQFWLKKSFVSMAANLGKLLGSNKNTPPGTPVPMKDVGSAGAGLAKVATPVITFLEAAKMDPDDKSFSAKFNLEVKGIVNANHDIHIDGKLFDYGIAIYVRTAKDQVYEKSILKNFSAMILMIPHASDMYLDFSIKMASYSLGVDNMVQDFLQSAVKGVVSGGMTGLGQ